MRKIVSHREYKGCTIWRNQEVGPKLRYTACTVYRTVSADTLAGIKHLISNDMDLRGKK